jgi:hypothetical protein
MGARFASQGRSQYFSWVCNLDLFGNDCRLNHTGFAGTKERGKEERFAVIVGVLERRTSTGKAVTDYGRMSMDEGPAIGVQMSVQFRADKSQD